MSFSPSLEIIEAGKFVGRLLKRLRNYVNDAGEDNASLSSAITTVTTDLINHTQKLKAEGHIDDLDADDIIDELERLGKELHPTRPAHAGILEVGLVVSSGHLHDVKKLAEDVASVKFSKKHAKALIALAQRLDLADSEHRNDANQDTLHEIQAERPRP